MKRMKKLVLTLALAGALFVGTTATSSAAELDLAWYAAKNPDVVAAFGNTPEMLKLHYEMFGRKEARMANTHDAEAQLRRLFNPTEYGTLYPDVQAAFGGNAEAMFQHYVAYGLLESRRPSEKVSKATAADLKKTVEKAMASAGLVATPGSMQLVAIITGEIQTNVADVAVQQVMTQVASVVEKAVTETVKTVTNPSSSGGGSSSSNSTTTTSTTPSRTPASAYKYTIKTTRLWAKAKDTDPYTVVTESNAGSFFDVSTNNTGELLLVKKANYKYATNPGKEEITNKSVGDYVEYKPAALKKENGTAYAVLLTTKTLGERDFEINDTGVVSFTGSKVYCKTTDDNNKYTKVTAASYVNVTKDVEYSSEDELYEEKDGAKVAISLSEYFEVNRSNEVVFQSGKSYNTLYNGNTDTQPANDAAALAKVKAKFDFTLKTDSSINFNVFEVVGITGDNMTSYVAINDSKDGVVSGTNVAACSEEGSTYTKIADFSTYFSVENSKDMKLTDVPAYGDANAQITDATKGTYFKVEGGVVKVISGKASYMSTAATATSADVSDYTKISTYVTVARN